MSHMVWIIKSFFKNVVQTVPDFPDEAFQRCPVRFEISGTHRRLSREVRRLCTARFERKYEFIPRGSISSAIPPALKSLAHIAGALAKFEGSALPESKENTGFSQRKHFQRCSARSEP